MFRYTISLLQKNKHIRIIVYTYKRKKRKTSLIMHIIFMDKTEFLVFHTTTFFEVPNVI